jgi:phosphoglycerate dehydrogenase-like enzyme
MAAAAAAAAAIAVHVVHAASLGVQQIALQACMHTAAVVAAAATANSHSSSA